MKIRNWKLEIGNLFIILLFPIFSFISPNFISAQTSTSITTPAAASDIIDIISISPIEYLFRVLFGLFIKTDYQIGFRSLDAKNQDMNDYGNYKDQNFKQKYSFAGSRLTDINSQNCRKGDVIRKVILGTPDYDLSQICSDSTASCIVKALDDTTGTDCAPISVDDLAHYFVQLNQPFYCDDNNKLIDIESSFIDKVNQITNLADVPIPESKKNCYKQIYNDFYLTPKGNSSDTEENTRKIIQTPLNANSQNPNKNNIEIKKQVDSFFTPANYPTGTGGLNGLIPQAEKI